MKRTAGAFILLAIVVIGGCNPFTVLHGDRVDVSLVIPIPSYAARPLQTARMVDPSTWSIEVTVSAPDFDPIVAEFSFAEHGTYQDGIGVIECIIENVPAGSGRSFEAVTRDVDGALLTVGSVVATVSGASDTIVELYLLPALSTDLDPPAPEGSSVLDSEVAPGRMAYCRIAGLQAGDYEIRLTSADDTDLYVFAADGSMLDDTACAPGAPTDECAEITLDEPTTLFVGIYCAAAGAAPTPFTLTVTSVGFHDGSFTAARLAQINASDSSNPRDLAVYNGALYFSADDGTHGRELWRYDGADLQRITDINPSGDAFHLMGYGNVTDLDGDLYFWADDGTHGRELWRYDGVVATRVSDINPGAGQSGPSRMAVYNDGSGAALYFRATADGTDYDLWRYTGSGSPELVDDLLEGAADGSMTYGPLVVLNGALYFTATSTTYGSELWRYDGAVASRLSDINPGSGHSGVRELTVAGSVLYFAANDGAENELWRFDGTSVSLAADTDEELDGADTQSGGSYPMELCSWAGDLYFTAKTDTYGMELYRYDGTSVTNAADIAPGGGMNGSSQPMHTTAFSIGLIVAATATGYEPMDTEPWHFNGASATLAADVNPMGSSDPTGFTEYNGALYFSACDDSYDYELWTLTY